jgi:hypothetical protein
VELLNPCIEMEVGDSRFDLVDNRCDLILKRALDNLEALVSRGESEIGEVRPNQINDRMTIANFSPSGIQSLRLPTSRNDPP